MSDRLLTSRTNAGFGRERGGRGVFLAAVSYTALLQALASLPNTTLSPSAQPAINAIGHAVFSLPLTVQDLAHVPLYAGLGALWCQALRASLSKERSVLAAIALSALLGLLIELSQLSIPGRVSSVFDAVVNIAAAVLGVLALASPISGRLRDRLARGRMLT